MISRGPFSSSSTRISRMWLWIWGDNFCQRKFLPAPIQHVFMRGGKGQIGTTFGSSLGVRGISSLSHSQRYHCQCFYSRLRFVCMDTDIQKIWIGKLKVIAERVNPFQLTGKLKARGCLHHYSTCCDTFQSFQFELIGRVQTRIPSWGETMNPPTLGPVSLSQHLGRFPCYHRRRLQLTIIFAGWSIYFSYKNIREKNAKADGRRVD